MSPHRAAITSLVWATDIDVLAPDHRLERRADHWVVSSPSNPTFWWGNFLLFDDAPGPGDGERWKSGAVLARAESSSYLLQSRHRSGVESSHIRRRVVTNGPPKGPAT